MKILYLITGLGYGGAERVVCDLADKMYEQGCEVKIAYLTGDILTKPYYKEIEIINLNFNNLISIFSTYFYLSSLIKNYNPDVVHAHMIHANLLARLVRITTSIKKLICTAHSANEGGRIRMFLYRLTHNLSDLTTNVSNYASNAYIEKKAVPNRDIITVYNGIDVNFFKYNKQARRNLEIELNIESNIKILLAVGRFHESKNYPNLIDAIQILKNSFSNFILIIAGDGELRPLLEKKIKELNLENQIILLGRRKDIPYLMSSADVFVLSSNYEGLPTVLIEAMACKAHVVSTDVSGASEIICKYGKIVPKSDPEALAKNILDILRLSKGKNNLGAEYIQGKFNLDDILHKWLEIYSYENN